MFSLIFYVAGCGLHSFGVDDVFKNCTTCKAEDCEDHGKCRLNDKNICVDLPGASE